MIKLKRPIEFRIRSTAIALVSNMIRDGRTSATFCQLTILAEAMETVGSTRHGHLAAEMACCCRRAQSNRGQLAHKRSKNIYVWLGAQLLRLTFAALS